MRAVVPAGVQKYLLVSSDAWWCPEVPAVVQRYFMVSSSACCFPEVPGSVQKYLEKYLSVFSSA